jgi:membrane protein
VHGVRARLDRFATRHPTVRILLDVLDRFGELQGGTIASAVTLNLFVALFPLLLVATAAVGLIAARGTDVAGSVVDALGLSGAAAQTVTNAVHAAVRSRRAAGVIGLVGLLWSALGVAGAVKTAIDRSWQATAGGLQVKAVSLAWLVSVGLIIGGSLTITGFVISALPGWAAGSTTIASTAIAVLVFWWTFRLLGAVDVGWRALLPGAVAAEIGFEVLTLAGALIVPHTVASASALYGAIGAVFAVLSWLLLLGRLLVLSCVLNVVLYERRAGTVVVEVEVPRIHGEVPLTGTRAGAVSP